MQASKIDSQVIAGNIYPRWKNLVQSAKESITIFTPYLDDTIISLLDNKPQDLNFDNIAVIVDFNPEVFVTRRSSLKAIRELITKGTHVKHLKGIHAKVLLIDDALIALGSQNFTQRGLRNKEASIKLAQEIKKTKFLRKLIEWREEAEDIDVELVEDLLSKFPRLINQYKSLIKESEEILVSSKEALEAERVNRRWQNIKKAEKRSRWKFPYDGIYASIKEIDSYGLWGYIGSYHSLVADEGYDITNWQVSSTDTIIPKNLRWLYMYMYPILNVDTLGMGFARIGETRITYIRDEVNWVDKKLFIGDYSISVSIRFPARRTQQHNIEVSFKESYHSTVVAYILFDGVDYGIIRRKYGRSCSKDFKYTLEEELFKTHNQFRKVFNMFFTAFRFKELGRDYKNITGFLKGIRYRLSLIEFADNPFLIAKEVD